MINMDLETLVKPEFPPDHNNVCALEVWREACKIYLKCQEEQRKVMTQVFPIVIGQCDPGCYARLNGGRRYLG